MYRYVFELLTMVEKLCCEAPNPIHVNERPGHRAVHKAFERIDEELLAVAAELFKTKSFLQRKDEELQKKRNSKHY